MSTSIEEKENCHGRGGTLINSVTENTQNIKNTENTQNTSGEGLHGNQTAWAASGCRGLTCE